MHSLNMTSCLHAVNSHVTQSNANVCHDHWNLADERIAQASWYGQLPDSCVPTPQTLCVLYNQVPRPHPGTDTQHVCKEQRKPGHQGLVEKCAGSREVMRHVGIHPLTEMQQFDDEHYCRSEAQRFAGIKKPPIVQKSASSHEWHMYNEVYVPANINKSKKISNHQHSLMKSSKHNACINHSSSVSNDLSVQPKYHGSTNSSRSSSPLCYVLQQKHQYHPTSTVAPVLVGIPVHPSAATSPSIHPSCADQLVPTDVCTCPDEVPTTTLHSSSYPYAYMSPDDQHYAQHPECETTLVNQSSACNTSIAKPSSRKKSQHTMASNMPSYSVSQSKSSSSVVFGDLDASGVCSKKT